MQAVKSCESQVTSGEDSFPISPEEFNGLLERTLGESYSFAIAVSGGPDSMALALLTAEWAKTRSVTVTALVVDHGLRAESAAEAQTVAGWLAARGISAVILKPERPITGTNLQEKARDARYTAMTRWCRERGVKHLLLAHHADDQLETLLMRLVRGSGLEGLAGMEPVSARDGVTLVRPLLSIAKQRLTATLQARRQPWAEDPSNQKDIFTRNRMRRIAALLREEGLSAARVATVAENLQRANRYMISQAEHFIAAHATFQKDGTVATTLSCWRETDAEIARRALKRLLCRVSGAKKPPRQESLAPVLVALMAGSLLKNITLSGCLLAPFPAANRLEIRREHPHLAA